MRLSAHKPTASAFTRIELTVVIAITAISGGMFLPSCSNDPQPPAPLPPTTQLKQIGLAMRLFANDHNGKLPMELSQSNGGVREIFENNQADQIYRTFTILSNYLGNTPRVLVDPADEETIPATTFRSSRRGESGQVVFDGNVHTSFGIAPGAERENARMLLAANRDIEDEVAGFRYGQDQIAPLGTNNPTVHWTTNHVHPDGGYTLWGDGSVGFMNTRELRQRLRSSGDAQNVWAQPGNSDHGE